MLRYLLIFIVIAAIAVFATFQFPRPLPTGFAALAEYNIDGNAEIVAAAGNGNYLIHTNTDRSSLDIIDLREPTSPTRIGRIEVPGEPASVGVSPDGQWAFATINVHERDDEEEPVDPQLPGLLLLVDLRDAESPKVAARIGIGHQPDGVAVSAAGNEIAAIIAIENKPVKLRGRQIAGIDGAENGTDISAPGSIQIVTLDPNNLRRYTVTTVELSEGLLRNALMLNPADPQPERVAISPGKHLAAISLQENNGIVLVEHATGEVVGAFSLGKVATRPADLRDDEQINLQQNYPDDVPNKPLAGSRLPDGIAFTPDGQYILSADKGQGAFTGGRGFSIWSLEGEFIWDDGGEIERKAAELGLYDDSRSDRSGIEIGGVAADRFGGRDYAFAVADRGSFVVIYDISNPRAPAFEKIIRVGSGPESVIAIPERDLIVVAAEKGAILSIIRHVAGKD